MRVFVGYGYNERDRWIEEQVYPILEGMGFMVVDGRGMEGMTLQPEIISRIDQSDAVIGFLTIREGQGEADFNSHLWVIEELMHANTKGKPIIPIKEVGVRVADGLFGDRQYIPLRQEDRLDCVAKLIAALGRRNIRRIRLEIDEDELRRNLFRNWRDTQRFKVQYRTQENGVESAYKEGRLELVDMGFYLNASDVPKRAYIEIEGFVGGNAIFSSGWASAEAVQVPINYLG
jgi:hypothetical protein